MQSLLFFSAFFLVLLGMAFLGIVRARKRAKTESEKRFMTLFFITFVGTFAAGALVRSVQPSTRPQWQNGFVGILGGIYISLLGVPTLWHAWHQPPMKYGRLKKLLALLISLLLGLVGAIVIFSSLYQVWESLA